MTRQTDVVRPIAVVLAAGAIAAACDVGSRRSAQHLDPALVNKYETMLRSADADVRAAGATEVARLGSAGVLFVPALLDAMRDNRGTGFEIKCPFPQEKCAHHVVEAQNQAIRALGAMGPSAGLALEALQQARESWELKDEADEAIQKIVAGRRTRG